MRFLLLLACAFAIHAQPRSFEVATVRRAVQVLPTPSSPGGPPPPPPPPAIRPSPTGLVVENASLQYCLSWAYGLRPWQVGGPDWVRDNRYTISARAGAPVDPEQLKPMLAALLEERLRLVIRRESKETRVLALTVADRGKLKPSDAATPSERKISPIPGGGLKLVATNTGLDILEQILSLALWPPVVNRTGLTGGFDFTFERPPQDPANREGWLSDIQASLRRQLGLTLTAQRGPVDTVTVERGSQDPIEN